MSSEQECASPAALLYPPVEPYASGTIPVDGGHHLYWETCGNPAGKPALFLHSGPGGGCVANHRRLFDPKRYRTILFDQRGCGRSRPHAGVESAPALRANTTAHLVSDMEVLRQALGIDRWLLLGGSWGATLALAYAQTYPGRVSALILRGVFTARRSELRWLYGDGASLLYPDAWEQFKTPIPEPERGDLVAAYHARLMDSPRDACGGDGAWTLSVARAWCAWEDALMTFPPQRRAGGIPTGYQDDLPLLALARIEAHYMFNNGFMEEGELISNAHRMSGIPGVVVQGRHDAITPAVTAFDLHRAWPGAEVQIVEDAGHASSEPGILRRLITATDVYART